MHVDMHSCSKGLIKKNCTRFRDTGKLPEEPHWEVLLREISRIFGFDSAK